MLSDKKKKDSPASRLIESARQKAGRPWVMPASAVREILEITAHNDSVPPHRRVRLADVLDMLATEFDLRISNVTFNKWLRETHGRNWSG